MSEAEFEPVNEYDEENRESGHGRSYVCSVGHRIASMRGAFAAI